MKERSTVISLKSRTAEEEQKLNPGQRSPNAKPRSTRPRPDKKYFRRLSTLSEFITNVIGIHGQQPQVITEQDDLKGQPGSIPGSAHSNKAFVKEIDASLKTMELGDSIEKNNARTHGVYFTQKQGQLSRIKKGQISPGKGVSSSSQPKLASDIEMIEIEDDEDTNIIAETTKL